MGFKPYDPNAAVGEPSMPLSPEGQQSVAGGGAVWDSAESVSSSNVYKWQDDTTATDPGAGGIKGNNATEALITELYINDMTLQGSGISFLLASGAQGDTARVAQFGITGIYLAMEISGAPVDNGGWWTVPVSFIDGNDGFLNGVSVELGYWPTGEHSNWGGIDGTLSNQADLQSALDAKQSLSEKGQASGYAPLDGSSHVPAANLPSYVDDVLEFADLASFPVTGETGKIYIAIDTNLTYRWSGSVYVELTDTTAVWGNISGLLSNQSDLQGAFNTKADKDGETITNATVNGVSLNAGGFAGFYLDGTGNYAQAFASQVINNSGVAGAHVSQALDNLEAAIPVYGSERHQVADLSYTSTTNEFGSPDATNIKLTLTTASLPAGNYVVKAYFQFMMTKDKRFEAGIYHTNAAAYLNDPMKYKSDEDADELSQAFTSDDLALSGVHTFELVFGKESGAGTTATMGDAVMEFMRVS